MPQSIIERQQPKYGQGSIRGLTNTEKRNLRRQNIKDAGKGGLASIYNALTDLPNRIAKVPAAAVDQIAGTDIQGAMDNIQSAPSQALRDSASNTKAFDKGSKVADALVGMAALLGAGRMGGSNVKTTSRPNPNSILDNMVKDAGYKQSAINNTNIPKYVEMTNNPKPSIGGAKKIKTTLGDIAKELGFKNLSQAKATAKQGGFKNIKEMFDDIIESNREAWAEYEATGPKADAVERGLYEFGDAQKRLNTSRARAERLKNSNRSKAERTLLKKTERDAAKAEEDIKNKTLEEMYDEWKRREDEIREAAEDAYNGKLRDEGRR